MKRRRSTSKKRRYISFLGRKLPKFRKRNRKSKTMTPTYRKLNQSKNSRRRKSRLRISTRSLLKRLSRLMRSLFKIITRFLTKTRQLMMRLTWCLTSSIQMMMAILILRRSKLISPKPVNKLPIITKSKNFLIKLTTIKTDLLTKRNSFHICRNIFKVLLKNNQLRPEPMKILKIN